MCTKKLAEAMGIPAQQAEQEKMSTGMTNMNEKGKGAIKECVDPIIKDIQKTLGFISQDLRVKLEEIILVGGTSQMPGLAKYIGDTLQKKTIIAMSPYAPDKKSILFVEAIGLAMRGLDKKWAKDPEFTPKEEKEGKKKVQKKTEKGVDKTKTKKTEEKDISSPPQQKEKKANKIVKKTEPESNNGKEESAEDREYSRQIKKQKITLAVVLVIGVIIVGASIWYMQKRKSENPTQKVYGQEVLEKKQAFSMASVINTNVGQDLAGKVPGKLLNDPINIETTLDDAKASSLEKIKSSLDGNDTLWETPIKIESVGSGEEGVDSESTVVAISWLVYNKQILNDSISGQIAIKNTRNVPYEIESVLPNSVEGGTEGMFTMQSTVTIKVNEPL